MKRISRIFSRIYLKNESGFTLIELMLAILITGILVTGIATAILQVMAVKALSSNILTASTQVENVYHYLIRDIQMCQNVTAEEEGSLIVLRWSWPEMDPYHRVDYQLDEDTGDLYRIHRIYENDGTTLASETRLRVARFIDADPDLTKCIVYPELCCFVDPRDEEECTECPESDEQQSVEITISASIGGYKGRTETRVIEVTPRLDTS